MHSVNTLEAKQRVRKRLSPVVWCVVVSSASLLPLWKARATEAAESQAVGTPAATPSTGPAQPSTNTVSPIAPLAPVPAANVPANDLAARIQSVTTNHSAAVSAIVKMAESGIQPAVLEAYARYANVGLLTPEEILYLHQAGITSQVITALIQRSGELRTQPAQPSNDAPNRLSQQPPAQGTACAVQVVATPPENYYVTAPPSYVPTYGYAAPSYAYADSFYPFFTYGYPWPFYYGFSYASFRRPIARPIHHSIYAPRPHFSFGTGYHRSHGGPAFSAPGARIGPTPRGSVSHFGGSRFGR